MASGAEKCLIFYIYRYIYWRLSNEVVLHGLILTGDLVNVKRDVNRDLARISKIFLDSSAHPKLSKITKMA